jgi:beta-1,4-mannosyltransferase
MKVSVSCLPVAGMGNPYQWLMMRGLRDGGLDVSHGHPSRFLGILLTSIRRPHYIHFDWETSYYFRRRWWMTVVNIPLFVFQVLFAKYVMGVKLVWTPHNVKPHDSNNSRTHRLCRRFFARHVDWIRVFSDTTISRLSKELKVSPSLCKVIPEGSYVGYYPNQTNKSESREKLGLDMIGDVFLYMGYIKPYKGILELVDTFNKMFQNATLIIAGQVMDKNYGEEIKRYESNQVRVYDRFIGDDEIQYFMNAADAVVLPFKNIENSGSVILAMGFGKVVLAPSMGVVQERLQQQHVLLYKSDVKESFVAWKHLTMEEKVGFGLANRSALDIFQWRDFSNLFI